MPTIFINGHDCHYELSGNKSKPLIVFAHSLGCNLEIWHEQEKALRDDYHILRYDIRGHGKSEHTDGSYSIELLGNDVVALLGELGLADTYFVGISLGGLIGQWLAINKPDHFTGMVWANTAAKIGNSEAWIHRAEQIEQEGIQSLIDGAPRRWFTQAFIASVSSVVAVANKIFSKVRAQAYMACCRAIASVDFRPFIQQVTLPVLIIAGKEDHATPVADSEYLVQEIPDAYLKIMSTAHLSNLEDPSTFNLLIKNFFAKLAYHEQEYELGMRVRRQVLGEAHVSKAQEHTNNFNQDFQKFITAYAWGQVWTRDGLSKRERSFITLAMLIALNKENEFKMHIRAAITNGVSLVELREIFLQAGVYCGLPAANTAYHLAEEVFTELNIDYKSL